MQATYGTASTGQWRPYCRRSDVRTLDITTSKETLPEAVSASGTIYSVGRSSVATTCWLLTVGQWGPAGRRTARAPADNLRRAEHVGLQLPSTPDTAQPATTRSSTQASEVARISTLEGHIPPPLLARPSIHVLLHHLSIISFLSHHFTTYRPTNINPANGMGERCKRSSPKTIAYLGASCSPRGVLAIFCSHS